MTADISFGATTPLNRLPGRFTRRGTLPTLDREVARWFLVLALGGGFGDHHRRAAELGTALAVERGFGDDPQRVTDEEPNSFARNQTVKL